MNTFYYKATDRYGKPIEGNLEALDYQSAVAQVRGLNYFPINISDNKPSPKFSLSLPIISHYKNKLPAKDLVSTTQQLATLVDSGLTLDKALSVLVDLTEKTQAKEVLSSVHKQVHAGSSFADALANFPNVFSKLYVNMIRAGEAGGTLAPSLNRVADFLEKSEELKANIRSAMIYPAILTSVGGFAVMILFTVVIPRFSKLFDELGAALPLPTKIMLFLSSSMTNHWLAFLIGLVITVVCFIFYRNHEKGLVRADWNQPKLVAVGEISTNYSGAVTPC